MWPHSSLTYCTNSSADGRARAAFVLPAACVEPGVCARPRAWLVFVACALLRRPTAPLPLLAPAVLVRFGLAKPRCTPTGRYDCAQHSTTHQPAHRHGESDGDFIARDAAQRCASCCCRTATRRKTGRSRQTRTGEVTDSGARHGTAAAASAGIAADTCAYTHPQHALSVAPDGVQRFAALQVSATQNHDSRSKEAHCLLDSAQSAAPQKRAFSWLQVF